MAEARPQRSLPVTFPHAQNPRGSLQIRICFGVWFSLRTSLFRFRPWVDMCGRCSGHSCIREARARGLVLSLAVSQLESVTLL